MKSYNEDNKRMNSELQEPVADYKKAELDLLKAAIDRTYTERFEKMMQLIKMNRLFRSAKITAPSTSL